MGKRKNIEKEDLWGRKKREGGRGRNKGKKLKKKRMKIGVCNEKNNKRYVFRGNWDVRWIWKRWWRRIWMRIKERERRNEKCKGYKIYRRRD